MSSGLKALLAAVEDTAKKAMKYSKHATLLYKLADALFVSAVLAMIVYILFPHWQLAAVGLVSLATAFATDKLSDHYYHKTLREVNRLQRLAYMTALSMKLDQPSTKIDTLEQEVKKRHET